MCRLRWWQNAPADADVTVARLVLLDHHAQQVAQVRRRLHLQRVVRAARKACSICQAEESHVNAGTVTQQHMLDSAHKQTAGCMEQPAAHLGCPGHRRTRRARTRPPFRSAAAPPALGCQRPAHRLQVQGQGSAQAVDPQKIFLLCGHVLRPAVFCGRLQSDHR